MMTVQATHADVASRDNALDQTKKTQSLSRLANITIRATDCVIVFHKTIDRTAKF